MMAKWDMEPAQSADTIALLRERLHSLNLTLADVELALTIALAEKDEAHKAGYEMARRHAADRGCHLVRYEVAMMKERGK